MPSSYFYYFSFHMPHISHVDLKNSIICLFTLHTFLCVHYFYLYRVGAPLTDLSLVVQNFSVIFLYDAVMMKKTWNGWVFVSVWAWCYASPWKCRCAVALLWSAKPHASSLVYFGTFLHPNCLACFVLFLCSGTCYAASVLSWRMQMRETFPCSYIPP